MATRWFLAGASLFGPAAQPLPSPCPVRLFRFLAMLVAAIVLHKRVMRAVQRAWAV
jgi:hypothetical protein